MQRILSKISYPCKPSLGSLTREHLSCFFLLHFGQFLPSLGTSSTFPKIEGSSYFPQFVFLPCVIILVPQKASPITGGKGRKENKECWKEVSMQIWHFGALARIWKVSMWLASRLWACSYTLSLFDPPAISHRLCHKLCRISGLLGCSHRLGKCSKL